MRRALAGLAWLLLLAVLGCQPAEQPTPLGCDISGIVVDEENHPVAGAVVRIQATDQSTTTDENGRFAFVDVTIEEPVFITAWAPGYYNGGGERPYASGATEVEIVLRKHTDEDNPAYEWVSAFASVGEEGNCENCHSALTPVLSPTGRGEPLPFDEWAQDAHALSTQNPRFLNSAKGGKTCQDCHMPHTGATYFALPERGAAERDPQTIFSHRMPGASDTTLLQNAVTMTVDARREGERITVSVTIVNDQTGHHVPTDSPLRQIILLVSATDEGGQALSLLEGPVVPEYGGVGDPANGHYAGLPGKIYAKILMELWTGVTPTGAYWNPTRIVSDNRIPAFGSDTSAFVFAAPADGPARVVVRLLFRRAYIELMEQKGWDVPDILMEQETVRLP